MSYTIVSMPISSSKYSKKGPYSMKPQYITVHNTANDASARNEVAYMRRNNTSTSYHVAVDNKEVVIAAPFNRNCFHAGDGRNGSRVEVDLTRQKTTLPDTSHPCSMLTGGESTV